MSALRERYFVHAWGHWFSLVHGWQSMPDLERPDSRAVAEIVQQVQPGVVLVEVSA